jgi:FAD-dependent urate hydroxylase
MLSRFLVSTNISVADALKRYEMARKDRVSQLVLKARQRTATIYGKDESTTAAWYEQLSQEPESNVIDSLAKVIVGGPLQ